MPRPLNEQTIVLTGASSGFGREAALIFGRKGANVVLAARDEKALREVAAEIEAHDGHALVVPTDVADWEQVEELARKAVGHFGRIDTWVNDAGIGILGPVADVDVADLQRLIQVNLMGQIHGVKAALPYMRKQGGGAFINIGSVAGVRTFPLQTVYSATKHGVKSFTEGLRLELQREPGEYHVTYIAPAAINTPFFPDAKSKLGVQMNPPPPVYEPEVVAESIVFAAENPRRDIFVGGGAKLFDILQRISPSLTDWLLTRNDMIFEQQLSDRPAVNSNLNVPPHHPRAIKGTHGEKAYSTSLYTKVFEWNPVLKPIALGALALGAVALIRGTARPKRGPIERVGREIKGWF
jgi:short-subunit dehydrogenase